MIKLFTPFMSEEAIENCERVLRSGFLTEGEEVKSFEHEFSQKFLCDNVVALNSGTSALELAYELAHLQSGDEVIAPVLTCTATNLPLVRRGVKVVFADISNDLNIDVEDVEKKITDKTKAIVFVHFGGNNRGLRQLVDLAERYGLILIEDAAQALGSDYWGKADYTCISLQAIKTITAGDGGFLICKSKEDCEKAKKLRWFGYNREEKQRLGDIDLDLAGYKYHMNNINASIGRGNLKHLDALMKHRNRIGKIYESYGLFAHSWLAGGFTNNYEGLKVNMLSHGIEIGQYHFRNDKYTIFGGRQMISNMDKLENKYFFVPYHHEVSELQAHLIGKLAEHEIYKP